MKRLIPFVLTLGFLAVPAVQAGPKEHRQSVERMLEIFQVAPMCEESLHAIVGQAVLAEPGLAGSESALLDFLAKKTGWEVLKTAVIGLYMAKFSEKEMAEIVRFYESPTGRKFAKSSPDIAADVMELVQEKLAQSEAEWEALVARKLGGGE